METFTIKRTLYKHINLSIDFFTYKPNVLFTNNAYTVNVNPIAIFRYINNHNMFEDKISYSENAYKMNPRNHNKIIKFFDTIVGWFYDTDLKDLFLINENDELIFNSDYRHINITLAKGKFETGMMKALPSVITIDDVKHEGIYLYINKINNIIMLTKEDVEEISNMIKNFNFINETSSLLSMIDYSQRAGNIITDQNEWTKLINPRSNAFVKTKAPFDK